MTNERSLAGLKVFNIFFIVLFVLSAALQYNDPDPLLWMVLYLYGALLCFIALRGKFPMIMYIAGLVVYLSYATYLVFVDDGVLAWIQQHDAENIVQSMKAERPWIEMTREFFGLALLVIALLVNLLYFRHRVRPHLRSTSIPAAS